MSSRSSKLLHLDPLSIALEKRNRAEAAVAPKSVDNPLQETPVSKSLPNMSSQPILSSQLTEQPRGGPVSNQPNTSRQPRLSRQLNTNRQVSSNLNLLASAPEVKGSIRLPHRYTDHLCRLLKPDEQAVYNQLYRLSWGWNKETCFISNPRLSERSNVPLSSMKRAVLGLLQKGLIEKTGHTNGYGKEQGVEYRVLNLDNQPNTSNQPTLSSQPNMAPINIKNLNTHTHSEPDGTTEEETERAPRGVGVGSKFSIEECKRYAEHLRTTGQGITNPGGYATTIHRTGEADVLIEAFLNPASSVPDLDMSNCPDCQGTGFYYPNGREQGVAKCPHSKLSK
jgi:hypothetical protein